MREPCKQKIASLMTIFVIDSLEFVQIEEKHGQMDLITIRAGQIMSQPLAR